MQQYSLTSLMRRLNYTFKDFSLLKQALTHRSHTDPHNERLEFLGDAILSSVISTALYQRFSKAPEGELSRLRAALVKGDTLAEIAETLDLGGHLQLGSGELKSGGFRRPSILAGALEALIAAIYLDADFEKSEQFILQLFHDRLEAIGEQVTKDPKTTLQEYLQAKRLALPTYIVVNVTGEGHAQSFEMCCQVEGFEETTTAIATSRRQAEQQAASAFLVLIQNKKEKK